MRKLFEKLSSSGVSPSQSYREKISAGFYMSFFIPSVLLLTTFTIRSFLTEGILLNIFNASILLIILVTAFYLVRTKNIKVASFIGTALAFGTVIVFYFTGGPFNQGHVWLIVFPVIAFILNGRSAGIFWTLMLYFSIIVGFVLSRLNIFMSPYLIDEFIATILASITVTLCMYIFENIFYFNQADIEKFKLAADNTYDQVVITDSEGTVLYSNFAVKRITGYDPAEAVGKKAGTLWGKLMPPEFYADMWDTIKVKKKVFVGEIQNKRKGGQLYTAVISISPVLDNKGKVIYFVGLERDITKEKEIDRMKTEFVSLASHQLRTPLTSIKWYLELIMDETVGKLTPGLKQYLKDVYDSNESMIGLVNSLLNISRIESGRLTVSPEPTNMAVLVDKIVKELEPQAKSAGLTINNQVASNLPQISIDPGLISQVLVNLLTNSIKYTRDGGHIDISIKEQGEFLVCSVKDTGIGIPEADKSKIFGRFFRGSNVSSTTLGSTGLGLYLAQQIIDISGGKIWFESTEGSGSTFYFSLPLAGSKKYKGEISLT